MDQAKFQEAKQAYDAGDFRTAAKSFLASAGRGAAGNGAAYHMAGNSLIRLRRYQDAVTVYGHALRDELYERRGAVHANIGQAYHSLGEYAEAVKSYEAALAEPDYPTPYKAWQGMASALLERSRVDEAAAAYRKAALDPDNPDAGKALVNLGLCFMALGRPSDAAEAYKAALGFDTYQGRGKALANLGQAYVALEEYGEAVRAFEKATQLHGHELSAAAAAAYELAAEKTRPQHETVEGWVTGEFPPVLESEPEGWDTGEMRALIGDEPLTDERFPATAAIIEPVALPGGATAADSDFEDPSDALGIGDEEAVAEFFNRTDAEMKQADRDARRAQRIEERSVPRTIVTVLLAILIIAAAVLAAWWFGFGWPTQTSTVSGMMSSYERGEPVDGYWVAVPDADVQREMAKIPPVREYSIDRVSRGRERSTVTVTVEPTRGTPLRYVVTLAREGVGWKVAGVENDWRSTEQ